MHYACICYIKTSYIIITSTIHLANRLILLVHTVYA